MGNKITVDFSNIKGQFKAMHGVGQPPMTGLSNSLFHYLTRAGIPYSRLHDVGSWMGHGLYVDIPNLFRDFDADENDPASYDFAFTDKIIEGLIKAGCEPYFRLGVTIENAHLVKAYRIFPPKDFEKWARICEHVIRHYNEGWADGYNFNITYWEIWNEPDDCFKPHTAAMWKGTPEEFFRLYSVTARHLKKCFGDTIKIGGYGNCGLYEFFNDETLDGMNLDNEILYQFVLDFMHKFFKYQQETDAPIDFYSWHVYDNCHETTKEDFKIIAKHADYMRKILDKYGYTKTEHHLNEWNLFTKTKYRDSNIASAKSLAFMLMMQNTSTDVMCFYDAGLGYSAYRAMLSPETGTPYRNFYAFCMYNSLYKLKNQVESKSDNENVFVQAARNNKKAVIVISNTNNEDVKVKLQLDNFYYTDMEVLRIDEENRYTSTCENIVDEVTIPAMGCIEIKLYDLR